MSASGVQVSAITGVHETLAALKELDANAVRRVNRAINKAASVVAVTARSLVDPQGLSGWDRQLPGGTSTTRRRGYDPSLVAAGIRVKRKRPRRRGPVVQSFVVVANTTAAGAIWEVAGRGRGDGNTAAGRGRGDGNTAAGRAMVSAIRARGGAASRTVWAAADQTDMGHVQREIEAQIRIAERLVQSLINRA